MRLDMPDRMAGLNEGFVIVITKWAMGKEFKKHSNHIYESAQENSPIDRNP
jgi:hypothetical protein